MTIHTPEGVDLDVVLAGLGSRFVAGLLDLLIETVVISLLILAAAGAGAKGGWAIAGLLIAVFLVMFGYDVMFETLNHGRTPGKAAVGTRVRLVSGQPVGFRTSAVRNVLRIVDGFMLLTLLLAPVGITSILVTARNQRLGDLAAGTVVMRDPKLAAITASAEMSPWNPLSVDRAPSAWDVTAVDAQELATVRRYLQRRVDLTPAARVQIGTELASRLWGKVAGAPESCHPEVFLEGVVAAKSSRA
jgi:uncharacterized RDD family membrane protein YckC